jgi:putative transposase
MGETRSEGFLESALPSRADPSNPRKMAQARGWLPSRGTSGLRVQTRPPSAIHAGMTAHARKKGTDTRPLCLAPEIRGGAKEYNAQALQQVLADLQRAFANFFERRPRYPRFKSRKQEPGRFRCPQDVKARGGSVFVPKIGWVRIRQSR